MTVHLVSETEFGTQGMGIHTAHCDLMNLLKEHEEIDFKVNGDGKGDVFHAHTYGLYYFMKGLKYRGKRIHTVHTLPDTLKGSIPFYWLVRPIANLYFKWVYDYANVCVAISPQVKERLEQMKIRAKVVRINNPIDTQKWIFTEEKRLKGRSFLGVNLTDKVVLGVGQLQKRKGIEDFIQMARRSPHLEFVWFGGRPFGHLTEGIKRIDEAIAKAPSNMTFTGLVGLNQMSLLYAAADIFVFPSYQENSPLAPIEAASCGLLVVFRNLEEYSKLYDSTYLAAETTSEFSDHINRLALGGSFYELGKSYSEQLVKQFDKEEVYQKLKALYESLIPDAVHEN